MEQSVGMHVHPCVEVDMQELMKAKAVPGATRLQKGNDNTAF